VTGVIVGPGRPLGVVLLGMVAGIGAADAGIR
jgi:hypothetical protein